MANSCNGCGLCCKLFLINLSQKEYDSGKYQTMFDSLDINESFSTIKASGANLLAQKPDGCCVYLKDGKCSIYESRSKVCRDFFCTSKSKKFSKMIKVIKTADKDRISSIFK